MLTIRYCKIVLVAIIASFFSLAAFSNLTDTAPNFSFVQHVLSMDTTFPTSPTKWRAIANPFLQTIFYAIIVAWEAVTALICWYGVFKLWIARHSHEKFSKNKTISIVGLTLGFSLYAFCFMVIGGEYFEMWQSAKWNAQHAASIFINMIGLVFLILLTNESI